MQDVYFSATKKALTNITSTFDIVWPMVAGLWHLRCSVNYAKNEFPEITESELAERFTSGSGIHGVNYKRAFLESSWESQQTELAWILLNSTIPIFEGWLEELKETIIPDLKIKDMQFPIKIEAEVRRLQNTPSSVIKNSFYQAYSSKRDRCYINIDALMKCYRLFKECRNCYMHNRTISNQALINAYNDYFPIATKGNLCVSEVPETFAPVLGETTIISLRGVVGFSFILIKILVSLDAELLCTKNAEQEFIMRYKARDPITRTLKSDPIAARNQVTRYVQHCGFPVPAAVDEITAFLLSEHLISN